MRSGSEHSICSAHAAGLCYVAVFGGDVEIAGQDEFRVCYQLFGQPRLKRCEPGEFVFVLLAANCLTVGEVGADDADVADCCGNQALLRVGEMRVAADDIRRCCACQQGHAVIGFLPGKGYLVASRFYFLSREIVIF